MPKKQEKIALTDLKKLVKDKILEKYGMSIAEFSKSEEAAKLGVDSNLPFYLTPKGSFSFNVFETLVKELGLGNLKREVVIKKDVNYYI